MALFTAASNVLARPRMVIYCRTQNEKPSSSRCILYVVDETPCDLAAPMKRVLEVLKWWLASGKNPQSFLDAKWISFLLRKVPESKKRLWALRLLSLSPHYFFDNGNSESRKTSHAEYLENAFSVNADSRVEIYRKMLASQLKPDTVVLDYGCGPGYLAKIVAPHVRKLYAVDISSGAIECARILNSEPNLIYCLIDGENLGIADGTIDTIYSFAVFQHLNIISRFSTFD
jgi:2-polyprenyl-3-methyl-5-hydroxy-6-metoxy-1,4-benzoquinol methylase